MIKKLSTGRKKIIGCQPILWELVHPMPVTPVDNFSFRYLYLICRLLFVWFIDLYGFALVLLIVPAYQLHVVVPFLQASADKTIMMQSPY